MGLLGLGLSMVVLLVVGLFSVLQIRVRVLGVVVVRKMGLEGLEGLCFGDVMG